MQGLSIYPALPPLSYTPSPSNLCWWWLAGKSPNLWPDPMDLGTLSTLEQSGDPNTGASCPCLPLWEGNSCPSKGPTPAGV